MPNQFFIIPGWQETCRRQPYKTLSALAEKKGYEVICIKIDWTKPLSTQIFPVGKDDIIFGFSLGAVLAWLVAQQYKCRKIILASMTPHYSWQDKAIKKALADLTGKKFVNDLVKNIKPKHLANQQIIMYGDLEDEPGDIIVPKTEHALNDAYIKTIGKLL